MDRLSKFKSPDASFRKTYFALNEATSPAWLDCGVYCPSGGRRSASRKELRIPHFRIPTFPSSCRYDIAGRSKARRGVGERRR